LLWQRLFAESFACEGGDLTCPRLLLARSRPLWRVPHYRASPAYESSYNGMWRYAALLGDWVTPTLPSLATASIDTTSSIIDDASSLVPTASMTTFGATHLLGTATSTSSGIGVGLGMTSSTNSNITMPTTFIDGKLEQKLTDIASINNLINNSNDSKRSASSAATSNVIHILSAPTPFKLHYADAHVRLRIDNATWLRRRRADLQRRWPITTITRPMAIICITMWFIAWYRSSLISPTIFLHWLWSSAVSSPIIEQLLWWSQTITKQAVICHVQIMIALYIRTRVAMQLLCPALYSAATSDFAWLCYCWLRARPSGLRMRRDQKSLVHRHLADSLSPLVSFVPNHCWSDASSLSWSHACTTLLSDINQLRFVVYIIIRAWLAITAPSLEANFVVPLPLIIHS
jgi:hypothetical protein